MGDFGRTYANVDVLYGEFLEVADGKKEVEDKDLIQIATKYQTRIISVN